MKIVIAPDSFKGSLTAKEAADAMAEGILQVNSNIEIDKIPLADGGEGTVDALVSATNGEFVETIVRDPLDREISALYGILGDGRTAVIEMAAASGITLLKKEELNPLITSTFGTGELIIHALEKGIRKFIIGIGGSATNDGGAGMAQALGVKFISNGNEIIEPITGGLLGGVDDIDISSLHPEAAESKFVVASDVTNPLLGELGCAKVYATQKGASPEALKVLESNMASYINIAENRLGMQVRNMAGAGAAGGFGAGAVLFLKAKIASGIDIILEACNFKTRLQGADLVLTSEGKIDHQTAQGKTLSGVARIAKEQNIPVIAFGGTVEPSVDLTNIGFTSIHPIAPSGTKLEYAMQNAHRLLKDKVAKIISKRAL